ncbi:MAG: SDR family NAD(P)-dependent oxidoreductase [Chloroflexi bacterium]|nr:SDR family NAD(P)-dependent oxidoreductase [Chloroflexota bacterium]
MAKSSARFKEKYGPWALIAGGSEGIGGAYASALAERGLNIVLVARRPELLESKAIKLKQQYGVETRTIELDLASPQMLDVISDKTNDIEIGFLVYNAALASVGAFFDSTLEGELTRLDINCRGPLSLTYHFGRKMIERKRGGIILMSSGAGLRGAPYYTHYAATKAYDIVMAESLWYEFRPYNVDVLACIAGLTSSPGLKSSMEEEGTAKGAYVMTTEQVVEEALGALRKQPSIITGKPNRRMMFILGFMPRKKAVAAIGKHAIKNFLGGKSPPQFQ